MKVKIKETRKTDTRNADSIPSKETLLQESKDHIKAVSDCMSVIAGLLKIKGQRHDGDWWQKIKLLADIRNHSNTHSIGCIEVYSDDCLLKVINIIIKDKPGEIIL